jgi:signal peptidase I
MARFFRGLSWIVGVLFVVGLIARATFLDVWKIPDDPRLSASLAPTLAGGDTVVLLRRGTFGFGDLVRCPHPEETTRPVIGRIAGLEGDRVETQGRVLLVNGTRYDAQNACAEPNHVIAHPVTGDELAITCDLVDMGGGTHQRGLAVKPRDEIMSERRVEPGTLFLLSDNRDWHDDSRDFGPVQRATCRSRIVFRLWSKAGWLDDKRRMTLVH